MAGLTFEDTQKALNMYYSGSLGDDVPKPQHRDGRIILHTPKGRRRLENITTDNLEIALAQLKAESMSRYKLIENRYKHKMDIDRLCEIHLMPSADLLQELGKALFNLSEWIVKAD